jgi:hypothetical protein
MNSGNLAKQKSGGKIKRSFIILLLFIILAVLFSDISISNSADVVDVSNIWGMSFFFVTIIVWLIGQHFLLKFANRENQALKGYSKYLRKLELGVNIFQYITIIGTLTLLGQLLIETHYNTLLLNVISTMSYGLASFILALLSYKFLLWYRYGHKFSILSYSLSSGAASISMVFTLVFFMVILFGKPSEITTATPVIWDEFQPGTVELTLQNIYTVGNIVAFILLWTSTNILLYHHAKRFGELKYWILVSLPLISFLGIFFVADQLVNNASELGLDIIYVNIIGYALPGIVTGILTGLPFWIIGRSIGKDQPVGDYMITAAIGLILFQIGGTATVTHTPFPPLGLAGVLIVGISSYLLFIGVHHSTISVSNDIRLREFVMKSAKQIRESLLLKEVASAEVSRQIENKVIQITKEESEKLAFEEGITTSLRTEELEKYVKEVLMELGRKSSRKV